jgi:2-(1,2-epoxy-1,2-dihydrophenyl)acetyl-CoA isomerase
VTEDQCRPPQPEPVDTRAADEPVVRYHAADGIALVTLNRPHRLNAVTPELVTGLCSALDSALADAVGAAVLTGSGRAFCAGYDLKEKRPELTEAQDRRNLQQVQNVTRMIRQAPFPVVAAVHGYALGAGCEFALCCDLVVAASDATFGFPEVGVGLGVTGGISRTLPLQVGTAKAKELVLLGEHFSATEARALGLVNLLTEPNGHLDGALTLAARLRDRPRRALTLAKFALDLGPEVGIEAAYEIEIANALTLHGGADAEEAALAFQRRRQSGG